QLPERSGGRVFLRRMMDFVRPRLVGALVRHEPRSFGDQTKERVDSDGKVRAPHQPRAGFFDDRPYVIDPPEPARRTDYEAHAQRRDPLDVFHGGVRNGEVDRHVDASEVFGRDAFEAGVIEFVQLQANVGAVRGSELLDELAHLAVTDEGDVHAPAASKTFSSNLEKNSRCRLPTAPARSASATTRLRLSSEAPWEIMRMFAPFNAPNTRAATPGVLRVVSATEPTVAFPSSIETAENPRSSLQMAGSRKVMADGKEAVASEVAPNTAGGSFRSKISKIRRR